MGFVYVFTSWCIVGCVVWLVCFCLIVSLDYVFWFAGIVAHLDFGVVADFVLVYLRNFLWELFCLLRWLL